MALFRLEAKVFSRRKRGRSVIAAAAYRTGKRLKDEIKQRTFDYSRRVKGVIDTMILTPEGAPAWAHDSGQLWNMVEKSEKRIDAQLSREYILAVPPELSADIQFETAKAWAQDHLVKLGMIAELSLHHTKSGKNPHVHILCTLRKLDDDKFSSKKSREWNDVKLLVEQRETWAAAVNAALEQAGWQVRVDHRSLKDRGIGDREPQAKRGAGSPTEKQWDPAEDAKRFAEVRKIDMLNENRPLMEALKKHGEIQQVGIGKTWWERSMTFMSRMRDRAKEVAKESWQRLLDVSRSKEQTRGPER